MAAHGPADAAADVAAGDSTRIRITFDEALDAATVRDQDFALRVGDQILPVGAVWDADALQVVLPPSAALDPGSGYTVQASAGLADALHTQLASAEPDLRIQLITALKDCHNDDSFGVVRSQLAADDRAVRVAALDVVSNRNNKVVFGVALGYGF